MLRFNFEQRRGISLVVSSYLVVPLIKFDLRHIILKECAPFNFFLFFSWLIWMTVDQIFISESPFVTLPPSQIVPQFPFLNVSN